MSLVYKEVFEDGYPVECEWAMDADSADLHKMRDQLRAHAAALEEVERLKEENDRFWQSNQECMAKQEQAERMAERLKVVLRELLETTLSQMPPAEAGKDAQDAWADRRAKARNDAATMLAARSAP